MRIGFGYDLHPLVDGRDLVLGGIRIPFSKGLAGHSDADCLIHAVCDAILGALGQGDIGEHFPDTDPQYHQISSMVLLDKVVQLAGRCGYRACNLDTTIVAANPRISPYKIQMRQRIAQSLGIPEERVSIKATTTNGLTIFVKDGIAAYAVVCLEEC